MAGQHTDTAMTQYTTGNLSNSMPPKIIHVLIARRSLHGCWPWRRIYSQGNGSLFCLERTTMSDKPILYTRTQPQTISIISSVAWVTVSMFFQCFDDNCLRRWNMITRYDMIITSIRSPPFDRHLHPLFIAPTDCTLNIVTQFSD